VDQGEEVAGALLKPRREPAEAFETVKEALDQVAERVELPVLRDRSWPFGFGGDDRLQAEGFRELAKPVRVVTGVADASRADCVQQ
jgi:hypothetical protein